MIFHRINLIALAGALFSLTALGIFEKKDERLENEASQGALLPPPTKGPHEQPKSTSQLGKPNSLEDWDKFNEDCFHGSKADTRFNPFGE